MKIIFVKDLYFVKIVNNRIYPVKHEKECAKLAILNDKFGYVVSDNKRYRYGQDKFLSKFTLNKNDYEPLKLSMINKNGAKFGDVVNVLDVNAIQTMFNSRVELNNEKQK